MVTKTRKIHYMKRNKPHLTRNGDLELFYADIRKYNTLNKEETLHLFDVYRNGTEEESKKAFEKLFNHNVRLVVSFTRDYCGREDSINDLVQEGCIGLMKAIDMFDTENGTPFGVYALYWIKRYQNLYKIENTPIVKQTNRGRVAAPLRRIVNELTQNLERVPTSAEILEEYNKRYPQKMVNNTNDVIKVSYLYIDDQYDTGTDAVDVPRWNRSEFDLVSASYNTCNQHLEQEDKEFVVKQLLEGLTPGETRAIKMFYGIGCMESSLKMIAHELQISPQRASQLCNSAIKKMKRKSKDFAYAIAN